MLPFGCLRVCAKHEALAGNSSNSLSILPKTHDGIRGVSFLISRIVGLMCSKQMVDILGVRSCFSVSSGQLRYRYLPCNAQISNKTAETPFFSQLASPIGLKPSPKYLELQFVF